VSFILAFNNLEITFYNIGAIATLPTIAWGTLRHGIEPELFSLAAVINGLVFLILIILFFLIRLGFVRLGYRGQ
jgi:ABC-type spermidine/putrescine transport system permease subunit II